jgi:hypothetical protein
VTACTSQRLFVDFTTALGQFDPFLPIVGVIGLMIAPAFLITLVSLPAGCVPAGKTRDGLPVGLQIVGPRFDEP